MKKNRRPLVRVDWVDSVRDTGWHSPAEGRVGRDMGCASVGFLVDDEEDHVTVASDVAWGSDLVATTMTIPRCAITRIRRLGAYLEDDRRRKDAGKGSR